MLLKKGKNIEGYDKKNTSHQSLGLKNTGARRAMCRRK